MTVLTARDIVRLNASQFAAAQGTLERAFFDYPLMVYACPNARPRARGVRALYTAILHDSLRYGEIYTSPGVEGVACWLPPERPAADAFPRDSRRAVGLAAVLRLEVVPVPARIRPMAHQAASGIHVGPHWFLATIGVDPASQAQGVGRRALGSDRDEGRRTAAPLLSGNARRKECPLVRAARL